MEHLNREIKQVISGMGSNVTDNSIVRAGKCLKKHVAIQRQFDLENKIPSPSGKHCRKSSSKDRAMIIEQLVAYKVFNQISGRVYPAFKKFDEHMYDPMSMVDFQAWMEQQLQKLLMFSS